MISQTNNTTLNSTQSPDVVILFDSTLDLAIDGMSSQSGFKFKSLISNTLMIAHQAA